MKTYYLSLVRGLCGYYVKFMAPDEETVRKHASEYFGRMWCSVYEEIPQHGHTVVINEDRPIVLDSWEWE